MSGRKGPVAQQVWAAQVALSNFEGALEDIIGDFNRLGHDYYDQSLEIRGAHNDCRLNEAAQRLCHKAGFAKVYVNHEDGWETHYTFHEPPPVRGWRRRYVPEPSSEYDRVIVGEPEPGYWEISRWPEGWNSAQMLADRAAGHWRIVPDPLEEME